MKWFHQKKRKKIELFLLTAPFFNESMQIGSHEVKCAVINSIKYADWHYNIFSQYLSLLVDMVRALLLVVVSYKYQEDMCWAQKNL